MPRCLAKGEPCVAVVGAMSAERGWLGQMLRPKSVKGADFLEFVKELQAKSFTGLTLLLDNASIHKTKAVREYCQKSGI